MKRIVVCYKWVNDESDLILDTNLDWSFSRGQGKISDYDKNAMEAAVQAANKNQTEAVALTFGNGAAKKSIKDVLSRGLSAAYWVNSEQAENADGAATAKVLAQALSRLGSGLIICADGASDTFARQVGPRIAARLQLPCITAVISFEIVNDTLIAIRRTEKNLVKIKTPLPALITVLPEISPAPLPSLKAILEAGKKPVNEWTLEDIGIKPSEAVLNNASASIKPYIVERKKIRINRPSPLEQVNELINCLRKEGVL